MKQAVCSDSYTTKHLVRDTLRPDKTADNLPYEKVGNNDPVCIADEVPFDIPDSWEWCRLSSVNDMYTGNSINQTDKKTKYTNLSTGYYYIGTKDVGFDHTIDYDNGVKIPYNNSKFKIAPKNCILLCIEGGSAGRKIAFTNQDICFGNKLCCFISYGIDYLFLYYYLQSPLFQEIFKKNTTGIIGGVSVNTLKSLYFPVPPLAEQKRIIERILCVEQYIDLYAISENAITSLDNSFPELLKKSILQEAVQGKLVPQDPNDEPASVLLERIRAEKQALIKAGKIKKDKNESVIFRRDNFHYEKRGSEEVCIDEELPFEIPRNWEWCYLGDVAFVTKLAGFEYTKYIAPNLTDTGIPLFKGKNVQKGKLVFNFEGYIPEYISDELSRSQISKKCLLTPYVGTIGNIAIFDGSFKAHLGSNVGKIELINPVDRTYLSEEYVLNYLRSAAGYQQLTKHKKATAQESISIDAIRNVIIPIPPTNEQNRIINILERLERKVHAL